VTVSNEIDGLLAEVRVDFGQQVRKGQILAELDKRELELGCERARAALAQALARIGLTPEQQDVIPETTPAIRQAQAQLDNWQTKAVSATRLVKTGDIANERFVEIEKGYSAAEAALDAARHELRVSLATIRSLKAEVKMAEKRLTDATLRAPFDGAVAERLASPGEFLRQNTPIVKLVKTYPLRLRVDIPETAAGAVSIGTTLSFTTDAIAGERFQAVVREVNPSLDARSRSLAAEARLIARDGRLRPGMFVQVELVVQRDATVVVVPKEAIRRVAGLTKLFAIENGAAVERKVTLGRELDGWVEVRDEKVRAGEAVAVTGLAELTGGATVQVTDSES
jgi:RND family efflux transporter MFP subunit